MIATDSDFSAMWDANIIGPDVDHFTAHMVFWYAVIKDPVVFERMWKKKRPYTVPGTPSLGIPDHVMHEPPDGAVGEVIEEMTDTERAALRTRILAYVAKHP